MDTCPASSSAVDTAGAADSLPHVLYCTTCNVPCSEMGILLGEHVTHGCLPMHEAMTFMPPALLREAHALEQSVEHSFQRPRRAAYQQGELVLRTLLTATQAKERAIEQLRGELLALRKDTQAALRAKAIVCCHWHHERGKLEVAVRRLERGLHSLTQIWQSSNSGDIDCSPNDTTASLSVRPMREDLSTTAAMAMARVFATVQETPGVPHADCTAIDVTDHARDAHNGSIGRACTSDCSTRNGGKDAISVQQKYSTRHYSSNCVGRRDATMLARHAAQQELEQLRAVLKRTRDALETTSIDVESTSQSQADQERITCSARTTRVVPDEAERTDQGAPSASAPREVGRSGEDVARGRLAAAQQWEHEQGSRDDASDTAAVARSTHLHDPCEFHIDSASGMRCTSGDTGAIAGTHSTQSTPAKQHRHHVELDASAHDLSRSSSGRITKSAEPVLLEGTSRHAERLAHITYRQNELRRELAQLLEKTIQSSCSSGLGVPHSGHGAESMRSPTELDGLAQSVRPTPTVVRHTRSAYITDDSSNDQNNTCKDSTTFYNSMHSNGNRYSATFASSLPQAPVPVSAVSLADDSCSSSASRNEAELSSILALQRGLLLKWGSKVS